MIKAGITGGAGYTAGELIRILLNHPEVELCGVASESNAGNLLSEVHQGLIGVTDLTFTDTLDLSDLDVVFMCSGHGKSSIFWEEHERPAGLRVIDLAQDFRDESAGYVYGLPEVNRDRIRGSKSVANPGCYATAIQLALLPLAYNGLLKSEVNITGITGSTGAGVKPSFSTHFSWRNDNLSVYKPFTHQHLKEITMTMHNVQPGFDQRISFIPVRGDFPRGIFVIATMDTDMSQQEALRIYSDYYKDAVFTHVADRYINLKEVVNTNRAVIQLEVQEGKLMVVAVIDNLLKGASGQAVQNMNLMFGLPEDTGLRLKASSF